VKIPYFPGCTLHAKARGFDASARAASAALDIILDELPDWTCCGAAFATAADSAMGLAAPARILASARPADRLLTLCSFCYHTLKRTNYALAHDAERRTKVARFIEADYAGEVRPVHLLEVVRDEVGFDRLAARVPVRLAGLKVAAYYGCLLLRPPEEMQFDDPERPTLLEALLRALGCEVVEFPHATECCGSFLSVSAAESAADCSGRILAAAGKRGAQLIVTSCPLCQYNLDRAQAPRRQDAQGAQAGEPAAERRGPLRPLPVLYFTQLMALALGCGDGSLCLDGHAVDPRPPLARWLVAAAASA
jgi:heterodisulfide reductase subunit B